MLSKSDMINLIVGMSKLYHIRPKRFNDGLYLPIPIRSIVFPNLFFEFVVATEGKTRHTSINVCRQEAESMTRIEVIALNGEIYDGFWSEELKVILADQTEKVKRSRVSHYKEVMKNCGYIEEGFSDNDADLRNLQIDYEEALNRQTTQAEAREIHHLDRD